MAEADAWVSGSPRIDDRGSIAAPWLPLDKPTSDEFISLLRTQIANDRLATQSAANDLAAGERGPAYVCGSAPASVSGSACRSG